MQKSILILALLSTPAMATVNYHCNIVENGMILGQLTTEKDVPVADNGGTQFYKSPVEPGKEMQAYITTQGRGNIYMIENGKITRKSELQCKAMK